ncbi:uncharacterized protein V1510DRAFT_403830 [Dipodascopsis tothii]|uniref:uncharacterized protein n=1 Tax=Dipodascopsis tothii TaxID=44089 RepID=UPI0034CEFC65
MSVANQWRETGITTVHVTHVQKISNEAAQRLLADFIATIESETVQNAGADADADRSNISNAVTQQLRRIDRDLCGLPPLERKRKAEPEAAEATQAAADEDVDMDDQFVDAQETADAPIDKAERKRLKKLRLKEEKRLKAEAKKAAADE